MPIDPDIQRITRLTPLGTVLAVIDAAVGPVAARRVPAAPGRVLAESVEIKSSIPPAAIALRDGWAVASELTADAGSMAPAPLPSVRRVDAGDLLPADADAVAPVDAVALRGEQAEALAPVAPGEGVLAEGGDVAAGTTLLQQGQLVTPMRAALLAAAGIEIIAVREPRVLVVNASSAGDARIDAAIACVTSAITAEGGIAIVADAPADQSVTRKDVDALILIGGTGSGRGDATVRTMAAAGMVTAHGMAISPGETAAFGFVGGRPVLALPGRLDAALAAWHLLGRTIVTRLTGSREPLATRPARLTHKATSTVGMTELIAVRCNGSDATPIASGYVSLSALATANGWILVRPESEGYPAESEVMVRPWP